MTSRAMAWVLGGMVASLGLGCSGERINNVGMVDGGGSGAIDAGGSGNAPQGGEPDQVGGKGGSTDPGSGGSAGGSCFDPFTVGNAADLKLALGPDNSVFTGMRVAPQDIVNYASQFIFSGGAAWEINANFPTVSETVANDTSLALPAELSEIGPNVGEVYIARRNCKGQPAAGHKLTIQVYWKLGGAYGDWPTEGIALGAASGKERVWFEDASKTMLN